MRSKKKLGVGGSNDEGIGSSGKKLETSDVATKWDDKYFGYKYSDTLSFPGRYYYEF